MGGKGNHKHGDCRGKITSEYRRWYAMKQRCYNENDDSFPVYGGRGITVCAEWRSDYAAFLRDMGRCPPGHLLDRINPDGNYEKGNCRWATPGESNRNYSDRNIMLTKDGETMCLRDWAIRLNIKYGTLWKQYKECRFVLSDGA